MYVTNKSLNPRQQFLFLVIQAEVLLQSNHFLKTDGKCVTKSDRHLLISLIADHSLSIVHSLTETFPPSYFQSPWTQTLQPTRLFSLLTADQPSRLCAHVKTEVHRTEVNMRAVVKGVCRRNKPWAGTICAVINKTLHHLMTLLFWTSPAEHLQRTSKLSSDSSDVFVLWCFSSHL